MREKLASKILFYDIVIGILPLIILSCIEYFYFTSSGLRDSFFRSNLSYILLATLFAVISIFFKTRVVLNPIRDMLQMMKSYQRDEKLKQIRISSFSEAITLSEAIFQLVETIREQEQEIHRTKQLRSVGMMASTLAHEIRNPLTNVKTTCQLMSIQRKNDELFQKYTPVIISELERINHIVENLLDFSRTQEIEMKNYDLKVIIDEIILIKTAELQKKSITIENNIVQSCWINTDKEKFFQVIHNVVRNAMEAVETEGKIKFSICQNNGFVKLIIRDDGCGISRENLEKIGTPFFTTKQNGNGIGFATSMKIMDDLHGNLDIKSVLDKGTIILIKIPLASNIDARNLG